MRYFYIGLMSGTSCDGIDASLVETDGKSYFKSICDIELPYSDSIKNNIQELFVDKENILHVEKLLTEIHAKAVINLLKKSNMQSDQIRAIGFHGQTIFHEAELALSCQIGNPHLLAHLTNIDVIHDFRRRDIALKGQGAPLIPIFHKLILSNHQESAAIINIGGVSNITYLHKDKIIAFDTGPGNALINDSMNKLFNMDYDDEGKIAANGCIDMDFIEKSLSHEYYSLSFPKSLDRNKFQYILGDLSNKLPQDIIANLTYLTSVSIVKSFDLLPEIPKILYFCGGGVKNKQILLWIKKILNSAKINSKILNINELNNLNPDYIESQGFAYIAARYFSNLPSAFPEITGSIRENICGCLVKK